MKYKLSQKEPYTAVYQALHECYTVLKLRGGLQDDVEVFRALHTLLDKMDEEKAKADLEYSVGMSELGYE